MVAVNKIPLPPNVQKNIEEVRNMANVSALFPEIRTWTSLKTINFCGLCRTVHLIQFSPHFSGIVDTCFAMDDWLQNPTAHTALSQILPCVDNATAYGNLSTSKDVTFQTVSNVNKFITNVANKNGTGPNKFSQSGPWCLPSVILITLI
ncbi:hypothetical protein CFP56_035724 [Quercus suber]|uniref:Uncharacterized protein n=1 Tax=Quercus suber TaxID=58331 RepID=A0AAW0JAS8_QUESU